MLVWLFWGLAAMGGLIGMAMLVAGWELARRDSHGAGAPSPQRVHSIDLNLGDPTQPAALAISGETGSPPTDSDARRRALAKAIERMSEPARPAASAAPTSKDPWEDTRPRVNLPTAEPTRPG